MFKFSKLTKVAAISAVSVTAGTFMTASDAKPTIKSEHSLIAKYLTDNIWNLYKNHKTKTSDFTLK